MRKKKSVTLKDLSEQLGLSVHTVSKALRGLPGMSEGTRSEVIRRAQEAGYRTKEQERAHAVEQIPLYTRKPFRFALVISDHPSAIELNQLILAGLQQKLSEYGHSIETVIIPYEFKEGESLQDWADIHQLEYMDGIFIPPMVGLEQEEHLLRYSIPRILINFPGHAAEVDSIAWDVGTAIHQSVRYLLSKGHRKIIYVGRKEGHRGFVIRWQSFEKAMADAGLECHPDDHMVEFGDWNVRLVEKLERVQPTAILCATGMDLAWIYHACGLLGKRIPDDISLISMQHVENQHVPQLSRPLIMIRESGIRAAERMLWRIANPHHPYQQLMTQVTSL
ncbi:LacI family DNA-binding transcriptional regulator [Paenibacillus sp. J2TS4]|uniref:LacI family DNA-binding transcriptional regulator n=1 Tax=Paenibacillus sp. J2TS4 TaxID=2807194 RepID=UPI001B0BB1E4|nr:LacI family DNA-binding transcriptional regulator [Paenibacillus sp. J2TS4]GIP33928.1 LacI family transcriptional regulator [Paenibacillus sp. J2TS4]